MVDGPQFDGSAYGAPEVRVGETFQTVAVPVPAKRVVKTVYVEGPEITRVSPVFVFLCRFFPPVWPCLF